MTSEEYGQYIDDFELDVDVMPGESLTEYIERRRREFESKADGGSIGIEVLFKPKRQNFFMGGPALEGRALSIYTSMKDYGATDQAIADRLSSLGLYDQNASTPDTPSTTPSRPLGFQGDEPDRTFIDRQDYSFNKKNYAPGGKLEINPAAFGMSFEKASPPQGIINAALKMPGRTLTSFASPTTGSNITGPAEEGFMSQVVDIDPAGRTREELRQQYDSYNRFLGAPSNFAAARTPGKFGQVLGTVVGAAAGIPFLGQGINALSKMGGKDRSDRSLYAVDNVGFGQGTGRDEFGVFTGGKTLLGDTTSYGERMKERLGELSDFFAERGIDINDPDAYDKMKDINSTFAKQVLAYQQRGVVDDINKKTRDAIEAQRIQRELEEAAKAKSKAAALAAIKKQGQADYNPNIHGPTNYGQDSQGNQSFDFGGGFGIGSDGGPVSNRTGRGRTGYSEGGLATMFTRRR